MEEELVRGEPLVVGVRHESTTFWAEIVLQEVRNRPLQEPEGNSLSFHILLPHKPRNLRNIDIVSLRTGKNHHLNIILLSDRLIQHTTNICSAVIQQSIHLMLEGLNNGFTGLMDDQLFFVFLGVFKNFVELSFSVDDFFVDFLQNFGRCNGISDTYCKPVEEEPVIYDSLGISQKIIGGLRPVIDPDTAHQGASSGPHVRFGQRTHQQFAPLDDDGLVIHVPPLGVLVVLVLDVVDLGDDHGYDLFASPERFRLDDGGFGDLSVPVIDPHQNVEEVVLADEGVLHCEQLDAQ